VSRIAITLDEHALSELSKRAQVAQEPVARTAARLVRDGLLSTDARTTPAASGGDPSRARQAPTESETGSVPGWLEPTGERERWRRELWSSVTALAERYPSVFSKLIADWWTDKALVEILGALGAWRAQLDAGENPDPRAELLFHDRLELLERRLTQNSDPTAARFTSGPPPSEWLT
jgi:hypothetical protein